MENKTTALVPVDTKEDIERKVMAVIMTRPELTAIQKDYIAKYMRNIIYNEGKSNGAIYKEIKTDMKMENASVRANEVLRSLNVRNTFKDVQDEIRAKFGVDKFCKALTKIVDNSPIEQSVIQASRTMLQVTGALTSVKKSVSININLDVNDLSELTDKFE